MRGYRFREGTKNYARCIKHVATLVALSNAALEREWRSPQPKVILMFVQESALEVGRAGGSRAWSAGGEEGGMMSSIVDNIQGAAEGRARFSALLMKRSRSAGGCGVEVLLARFALGAPLGGACAAIARPLLIQGARCVSTKISSRQTTVRVPVV